MKLFEEPKIEVIRFVTESILDESGGGVPEITLPENQLPMA